MKDEALDILKANGIEAAIECFRSGDEIIAALDGFNAVGVACYNERKSVQELVDVYEAGIAFGMASADHSNDASNRHEVLSKVKALHYNLGANTWPGWGDDIEIPAEVTAKGAQSARHNLELAHKLKKGDLPLSRAYWLAGAHDLAVGDNLAALENFDRAREHAELADESGDALLNQGYALLVRGKSGEDTSGAWETLIEQMRSLAHGDFYIGQLETARNVFG
jgi:tetratricopeptide (TPR) repeat protein